MNHPQFWPITIAVVSMLLTILFGLFALLVLSRKASTIKGLQDYAEVWKKAFQRVMKEKLKNGKS